MACTGGRVFPICKDKLPSVGSDSQRAWIMNQVPTYNNGLSFCPAVLTFYMDVCWFCTSNLNKGCACVRCDYKFELLLLDWSISGKAPTECFQPAYCWAAFLLNLRRRPSHPPGHIGALITFATTNTSEKRIAQTMLLLIGYCVYLSAHSGRIKWSVGHVAPTEDRLSFIAWQN
jgi:hypothetical protein